MHEDRVKNIVHESCVLVTHFTPMFHFFNRLKWVKFKETYKDFKVYQRKKTLQWLLILSFSKQIIHKKVTVIKKRDFTWSNWKWDPLTFKFEILADFSLKRKLFWHSNFFIFFVFNLLVGCPTVNIWFLIHILWTQNVNWTYMRSSKDVLDIFWTSYVRSIYVLCSGDSPCQVITAIKINMMN